jgi:hypothetical protein
MKENLIEIKADESIEQVLNKYNEKVDTTMLRDSISANLKMVFAGNVS